MRSHIKETPKSAWLALYGGNSLVTGEFPTQRASNAEKASIWWRYHVNGARCDNKNNIDDAIQDSDT